jgi:hypothetical protein
VNIKLDPADVAFSQYVRLRDGQCSRCGSKVELNITGLPVSHQNSHYFGRAREATRFEPTNCDTLCHGCHQYWGSTDRESYRTFKIKQLGQAGFELLTIQANSYHKKDRVMALIIAKALLAEIIAGAPPNHDQSVS